MKFLTAIISHKRPNEQYTYDALHCMNYKYPITIFVDDEDETKDEYLDKYGSDVFIFGKYSCADKAYFDTGIPVDNLNCAMNARNAVLDYCRENGYSYVLMLDDDLSNFVFRYVDGTHICQHKISDFTKVVDAFLKYMSDGDIDVLCPSFRADYIGGVESRIMQKRLLRTGMACCMLMRVSEDLHFAGYIFEDMSANILLNSRGKKIFRISDVCYSGTPMGDYHGGNEEMYASARNLEEFITFIQSPSNTRVNIDIHNGCDIVQTLKKDTGTMCPKIINERFRNAR